MTSQATGEAGGLGGQGAGLVPSKSSLRPQVVGDEIIISLGASVLAEKRVAKLRRSVWASGHLHALAAPGHRPSVPWFVTLTYAKADAWEPDHISKAVQRFRNWCRDNGYPCRYTWVAEIQPKRLQRTGQAVVHYHLLAWLPVGVTMPKWDRPTGRRRVWWPHGMAERDIARTGVGYLMKYLSKLGEFHRFPPGLRLYGIGGLTNEGKAIRGWHNLPQWAKQTYGVGDLKRCPRGLMVRATGEFLISPWRVFCVPGGLVMRLVAPLPPRFADGPYSTVRVHPC